MSPERWQQIESVFQAAIDMPEGRRGDYLSEACASDGDLLAEVERLLANFDSAEGFIESPVWTDSNFLNSTARKVISDSIDNELDQSKTHDILGSQIGAYRLVSEIGRGGMGAVYLAERSDGEFAQKVAIKLIKRGMDSDFIVRRFRHERQILASFEHPFIARLLDGGTTGEGIPYFVMEFIEGKTLYQYCDSQLLDIPARLKLFQKICSAIGYAHERQIIHRDIKPSNILINKYGNPKLLDFGIAKILDPDLIHESVNPTASVMRMMTPDYASPEQVQGLEITPSSDIYSLGILLYELLTGHRPYNFSGRALHEVSRVICEVSPELPSHVLDSTNNLLAQYRGSANSFAKTRGTHLRDLKDTLTGDIDNIVMTALCKDPAERYRSAKLLADDIANFTAGQKVSALPFVPHDTEVPYKHLSAATNTRALAVLPFRFLNLSTTEETDDHFLGLGLADALISRLSKIRRFVVRPTSSILSFGDRSIDPIRAGRELNVDYVLDGNIKKAQNRLRVTVQLLNVKDNAAVWATSIDEVIADVFALEDTLSNKLIEVLLPQLTGSELAEYSKRGTKNPEAFEHYLRGRYFFNTFTEEGLAKAFVSFHSAIAADPDYAHAYSGIADYYNWLGIIGVLPPQECFQPAIRAAAKAVELDDDLSEAHASLGFSLHAGNHDWANAENHLRRAIELSPSNASAYVWYSIVLCTEGRFTDSLEFARRSVDLDPLTPFNHHNIGWVLYYARRYDEAIAQYNKVVAEFSDYGFAYYGLSKIHRLTGETQKALDESEKTKELLANSIFSLTAEAECLAADGQLKAAKELISRLDGLSSERYVSPYQMALVHCYLGDKESAFKCLQKALDTSEAWLNWVAVEPVFDLLRDDPRFGEISKPFGYRSFLENSMSGGDRNLISPDGSLADEARFARDPQLHNLTTLVINTGESTDGGIGVTNPSETKRLPLTKTLPAAVILLAVVVLSAVVWKWSSVNSSSTPAAEKIKMQNASVVILPFAGDDSSNTDLGIGLADALTNRLGNIKSLQMISATTGSAMADADNTKIESEIGPTFVVRGQLSGSGDDFRLHAEMTSVRDEKPLWSEDFSAAGGDLFSIQTKLAEKVWTSLGIEPLPMELQQVNKSYYVDGPAYQLYLIGRFQMANRSSENLRKAIDTFSRAVENDPGFALAYVGLADASALLNLYDIEPPKDAYPKALEYAKKALSIDDDLAEAHASLGYVKFYHERDRAGAELEYRRAIQMNPSYARAHHWFALMLSALNRPVEALSEAQIAQRLDPRSPAIKSATAIVYFMSGRYEEALAECDKSLALNEGFVPALKVKRWTYAAIGDRSSAMEVFQKELSYSGGKTTDPGWKIIELQLVSPAEDRNGNLSILEKTANSQTIDRNPFAFAFEVALAYNNLGEKEKAIDWLEKAETAISHSTNFLAVDPRIANLREEPRFQHLAKKFE